MVCLCEGYAYWILLYLFPYSYFFYCDQKRIYSTDGLLKECRLAWFQVSQVKCSQQKFVRGGLGDGGRRMTSLRVSSPSNQHRPRSSTKPDIPYAKSSSVLIKQAIFEEKNVLETERFTELSFHLEQKNCCIYLSSIKTRGNVSLLLVEYFFRGLIEDNLYMPRY